MERDALMDYLKSRIEACSEGAHTLLRERAHCESVLSRLSAGEPVLVAEARLMAVGILHPPPLDRREWWPAWSEDGEGERVPVIAPERGGFE